jgi:hypothetical protein
MITVVYCTRKENPKHKEHIKKTSGLNKHIEIIEIVNNGEGLTKAYNRGLQLAKNDIVVFMHDDVTFDTSGWGRKLIKHFEKNLEYGILGLAGTTDLPISGKWWEDRSKMVGIVNHENNGKKWESKYSNSWGNELNQVVLVDGLFFAVHKNRIKLNFDEKIEGFHFYEIDFCLSNHLNGVNVGVMYDIRVTHKSIGVTNEQWEINRQQFVTKFNDELPEKIVPDFYNDESEEKTDLQIRVIIQSNGDIETFNNLYQKIKSFDCKNLKISLITNQNSFNDFKKISYDDVIVHEGLHDSLPKNVSLLKYADGFVDDGDDLIFLMNDNLKIINNIFNKYTKLYKKDKNSFGCGFPLSYNENKTIFCSRLDIYLNNQQKIAIDMKDSNTYYNVSYGHFVHPIGNLSDCIVTTLSNLEKLNWLNVNYETPLYFNEYSLKLFLNKKNVYVDTGSLTIQKSFSGQSNIQKDFQSFINLIGSDERLKKLIKQIL